MIFFEGKGPLKVIEGLKMGEFSSGHGLYIKNVGKREFTDGEVDKDRRGSSSDRQGGRRQKDEGRSSSTAVEKQQVQVTDRPARSTARSIRRSVYRAVDRVD